MKKILYIAICCATVAAMGSCHKKAAATPGAAAKQYSERIMNDDYDAFVDKIHFTTQPVKPEVKKVVNKAHATALRTVHHPDVTAKGGMKEVRLVSEKMSPDKKECDVVLTHHYNNGAMETVNYRMINDENEWKIKANENKEVWRTVTQEGDHEVLKIREGHDRDFIKEKDNGEKEFVKDIIKRNGDVEVIKVLANGERHREVIKTLDEGNREIDKLKIDGEKIDVKDIDRANKEILKEKDNLDGEHQRVREVIRK